MTRRIGFLVAAAVLSAVLADAVAAAPQRDDDRNRQPFDLGTATYRLPPDLRMEIAGMQYLLTDEEMRDLLRDKNAARCRRWIDDWWAARDPIFTTEVNEVRVQHEARVEQAREWYRLDRWPGWDQRGEVQIRYGTPAWKSVLGADVTPKGYERPGEVWAYPALGMLVVFEDAFGNGDYTYYSEHVKLPPGMRPASDRLTLGSEKLPDKPLDAQTLDATMNAMLNDGSTLLPDPTLEFEYDDASKMINRFFDVLEKHPVMYPSDFDFMKIPLDFDVACFRGGEGVDRVDVNAEFLADARAPESMTGREYRATVVVRDTDGEVRARREHLITLPAVHDPEAAPARHLSQLSFTLPPAFYHFAITIQDDLTGRFASERGEIACRGFDRFLQVSDILCAGRIGPAEGESRFNRGALVVVPHPRHRYALSASIPFYFEVYNLTRGRDGHCAYTVAYRLIPETPRPLGVFEFTPDDSPLDVSSRFTSRATGTSDTVYLSIRSENLWAGRYRLEVEVTDEASNAQVTRDVTFHVVASAEGPSP